MKTDGRGKEQIKQIISGDSELHQIIGLSQYGRIFYMDDDTDTKHGDGWVLHTGRELYEEVEEVEGCVDGQGLMNVEDIKHEETIKAMNVLNDVEIGSENLRRLYEYFTDPAQGNNTVRRTSDDTGVSRGEVKAFYEVFKVGTV